MSLLMDALRKAEEAKKLAAKTPKPELQKSLDDKKPHAANPAALEPTPAVKVDTSHDLALNIEKAPADGRKSKAKSLDDIHFDFQLDEIEEQEVSEPQASVETKTPAQDDETIEFVVEPVLEVGANDTKDEPEEIESSQAGVDFSELSLVDRDESSEQWNTFSGAQPVVESHLSLEEIESSSDSDAHSSQHSATKQNSEDLVSSHVTEELDGKDANLAPSAPVEESQPEADSDAGSLRGEVADNSQETQELASELESPNQAAHQPQTTESVSQDNAQRNDEQENTKQQVQSKDAIEAAFAQERKDTLNVKQKDESRRRESARAVFSAKQDPAAAKKRGRRFALVALILLFPLAGAGYWIASQMGLLPGASSYNVPVSAYDPNNSVWPESQPANEENSPSVVEEASSIEVAETSPETTVVATGSLQAESVLSAVQTVAATAVSNAADSAMPTSVSEGIVAPPQSAEPTAPDSATEVTVEQERTTESTTSPSGQERSPINVVRRQTEQIDPQLTRAYSAYRAGDYVDARALYQQALRNKPNSRDAMLGLAAVAMQVNDAGTARAQYSKLLELDPRDALARVGLLESVPSSDPVLKETELRGLFEEHPEVAPLAFALGNLFASQGRWSDAQQSYYDALLAAKTNTIGPVTPDYAFNLAISLEQLNQPRPALSFYREALAQAQVVQPTFDISILLRRLEELEKALQ